MNGQGAGTEFERAVRQCPAPVGQAYQRGLQALGAYSNRVRCRKTQQLTGSINLERAVAGTGSSENLWDYGIGYRRQGIEVAVWIEVHAAHTGEVKVVMKKLDWLRRWLQGDGTALQSLTNWLSNPFWWVATDSGVHIRAGSPQERLLRQSGLMGPKRNLDLDRLKLNK